MSFRCLREFSKLNRNKASSAVYTRTTIASEREISEDAPCIPEQTKFRISSSHQRISFWRATGFTKT
jgi:hypothetical protein